MEKTLVVLAGPTAVGKTRMGIQIARHFQTEIVSADSRQLYRETSIGTAVPSPEELAAVRHHFIQTISVNDPYNASKYEQEALECVEALFQQHRQVLMVGGSGLYINAVCHGIDDLPPADMDLRRRLHEQYEKEGLENLITQLRSLDPPSYERIDLQNHMRVLKALEVSLQTGRPYSDFLSFTSKTRPFRILRVALDMSRDALYGRINSRVDRMMEAGLLEEVRRLQPQRGVNALKTVGYRELFSYLDGKVPLEEAVDLIRCNTRKFARKQLTWFRKDQRYTWFHPDHAGDVIRWIEEQLDH